MNNGGKAVQGRPEDQGPGLRPCCIFGPITLRPSLIRNPLFPFSNVTDLTENLDHRYGTGYSGYLLGTETSAILYTCSLGFLDLGHVRDILDLTLDCFRWIRKKSINRSGGTFPTFPEKGKVRLTQEIPPESFIAVARSIAYNQSIAHEILTYWEVGIGKRDSAFSPEDLVSNLVGTYLGEKIIRAIQDGKYDGDIDQAATAELKNLLTTVDTKSKTTTSALLDIVASRNRNYRWIDLDSWIGSGQYLRKRNFHLSPVVPWPVADDGCTEFPKPQDFSFTLEESVKVFYELLYEVPERMKKEIGVKKLRSSEFSAQIQKIKDHARATFGENFDRPLDL